MSTDLSHLLDDAAGPSQIPHKTKKRKHVERDDASPAKKRKHARIKTTDLPNHTEHPASRTKPEKKKKKAGTDSPVAVTSIDIPTPPSDIELPDAPGSSQTISPAPALSNGGAVDLDIASDNSLVENSKQPTSSRPLADPSPSPFTSLRLSLYLALSAISLSKSTALPSLLTEHISPLLLTYYAPAKGVVLAFSDPVKTSREPVQDVPPQSQSEEENEVDEEEDSNSTLALCADDHGISYVWLTITFLIFRPDRGQELLGWMNVCSEGFVGLVSYNYFQAGVGKARKPADWTWNPPGLEQQLHGRKKKKPKKERIRSQEDDDEDDAEDANQAQANGGLTELDSQTTTTTTQVTDGDQADQAELSHETGYFSSPTNARITGTLRYRVVDTEIVPRHDKEKWSLQIDGTLLSTEEEGKVLEEERIQDERRKARLFGNASKSASVVVVGRRGSAEARGEENTPFDAEMTGGLDMREERGMSRTPVPEPTRKRKRKAQ